MALLAAALLAVAGVFVLLRSLPAAQQLAGPSQTKLRVAYETCGRLGELADADRTLFLDLAGKDAGSGTLGVSDLACVLNALDTPQYVSRAMEQTRALDGRQSETWGSFSASWTYHPDDGLNVLIRER